MINIFFLVVTMILISLGVIKSPFKKSDEIAVLKMKAARGEISPAEYRKLRREV